MKKQTSFLTWMLLIVTVLFSCTAKQNVLTEQEKLDRWKLLFDGQSLNGWKNYNAPGISGWAVEGPEYQLLDDVGFLQKVEDWQMTGADYAMHVADSTVKKLNPVGERNSSRIIFDNGHVEHWLNGNKIVEFEAWTPEWFRLKNSGKWTSAPEYGLSETGYISLQDHGSKVWFRNMKIKELPKKEKQATALFNGVDLNSKIIDQQLVDELHKANAEIWRWTVDALDETIRMKDPGVNVITTNRPTWLKEQMVAKSISAK